MPKRIAAIAVVAMMTAAAAPAASDFYAGLLGRGIASFNAGNYAAAVPALRLAAFGLLDSIDQFETAEAYLALAQQRLGQDSQAQLALQQIVEAEKLEHHFARLELPADVRNALHDAAGRLLTADEHAVLYGANAKKVAEPPKP
jgi:tetratricopeptide (TPR) repeat protein